MTTTAQLVLAAILNFLGMAPEAQHLTTAVKAEVMVANNDSNIFPKLDFQKTLKHEVPCKRLNIEDNC